MACLDMLTIGQQIKPYGHAGASTMAPWSIDLLRTVSLETLVLFHRSMMQIPDTAAV